jgi:phosphoglycerate kinase
VGKEFSNETAAIIKTTEAIEPNDVILDIGPATAQLYAEVIKTANTIIWNGPVGVFEFDQFSHGTRTLANAVKDNAGFKIVGGGDTVAVIEQYKIMDSISYISTGGGAFLEFIKCGTLPILDLLKQ